MDEYSETLNVNENADVIGVDEGGVDLSELEAQLTDGEHAEQDDASEDAGDPARAPGSAKPAPAITSQKDFNAALNARLNDERTRLTRRYEQSPEYLIGQQLLQSRMAREGISAEEAARKIADEHVAVQAEQYQKDPKAFYADWLRAQRGQPSPKPQQQEAASVSAGDLAAQLVSARASGKMPQTFTPDDVNANFVADATQFGVERALALWAREHAGTGSAASIAAELQRRQAQPQPMRSTGDNVGRKPVDFLSMSDEDFEKWDKLISRKMARGEQVRLR